MWQQRELRVYLGHSCSCSGWGKLPTQSCITAGGGNHIYTPTSSGGTLGVVVGAACWMGRVSVGHPWCDLHGLWLLGT